MINIHVAVSTILAFIGVICISAGVAFFVVGPFVVMSAFSSDRWPAVFIALAVAVFGALTYFLGGWAGLW